MKLKNLKLIFCLGLVLLFTRCPGNDNNDSKGDNDGNGNNDGKSEQEIKKFGYDIKRLQCALWEKIGTEWKTTQILKNGKLNISSTETKDIVLSFIIENKTTKKNYIESKSVDISTKFFEDNKIKIDITLDKPGIIEFKKDKVADSFSLGIKPKKVGKTNLTLKIIDKNSNKSLEEKIEINVS